MKVCPTCERIYDDDALRYCLMDGAPLADGHSEPTIVVTGQQTAAETVMMTGVRPPRVTAATQKAKSKVPWIIAAAVGMLILVAISAFFLAMMMKRGEQVRANQNASKNASRPGNSRVEKGPIQQTTPVPTFEPEPSMPVAATPEDVSDEVTPISWATAAITFNSASGRTYSFECPPEGTAGIVWGSDIYTGDSSICTAAVHAGVITLEDGGEVTVEYRPGRTVYGGTTRNGITSLPFGQYTVSFEVRAYDSRGTN